MGWRWGGGVGRDISKGAKHMSTVRSAMQILPLSSLPFPNLIAELKHCGVASCAIMKGSKERCFSMAIHNVRIFGVSSLFKRHCQHSQNVSINGCTFLVELTYESAFSGCTFLVELTCESAFSGCTFLVELTYASSLFLFSPLIVVLCLEKGSYPDNSHQCCVLSYIK